MGGWSNGGNAGCAGVGVKFGLPGDEGKGGPACSTSSKSTLHKGENGYSGLETANLVDDTYLACTSTSCDDTKMRTDNDWDGISMPPVSYQEGLIRFDNPPALPQGTKIAQALLTLWFYPGHTCRRLLHPEFEADCPTYIDVFAMARPWSRDATWFVDGLGKKWTRNGALEAGIDYLPNLRSVERLVEPPCGCTTCFSCPCKDSCNDTTKAVYESTCMTHFTCLDPLNPLAGGYNFDITDIAKAWYAGQANYGVVIRGRKGPYWYDNNPHQCNPHVEFYFAGMDYKAPGNPAKNLTPRLTLYYQ